ncbi:hypothetical protein AVEN_249226-1 [Araneus ventricosus]|uniref:Integrase catalytic domain-containing protein n=1 Tax=Araneus ventricosus TaxID=182803 RepID=A0A4Y2PCD2_ARAVE|nr:hypothetical protein AVEN_249226-1 [Araneus ventricosus]
MVLSNDQQYPYDICLVISRGECYSDLALRKPGPVVHSRWLTIAGRILRLYVVTEKLSDNLIILATYIMKGQIFPRTKLGKPCGFLPMVDQAATTIAQAFLREFVSRFGVPEIITTDRATNFQSHLSHNLANLLESWKNRSKAYNPKSNGMIERVHRQIKAALMAHCTADWVGALPLESQKPVPPLSCLHYKRRRRSCAGPAIWGKAPPTRECPRVLEQRLLYLESPYFRKSSDSKEGQSPFTQTRPSMM